MLPILPLAVTALAGAGAADIIESVFVRRQPPVQAVASINWTRIIIVTVAIVAAYYLARNLLKR